MVLMMSGHHHSSDPQISQLTMYNFQCTQHDLNSSMVLAHRAIGNRMSTSDAVTLLDVGAGQVGIQDPSVHFAKSY
jgi:hypothetical protein